MSKRETPLVEGEYYHVFNRGVDKRVVFEDKYDFKRFLTSLVDFNSVTPIGSIFENSFRKKQSLGNLVSKRNKNKKDKAPLVEFTAYCLNPNHFHLILKQVSDRGIEKFMHRLGLGYTKYFNEKNKRSGSLFQGTFKSIHIENNEQLLYLSSYVNLNNRVHGISDHKCQSSWHEYTDEEGKDICNTDLILKQFRRKEIYTKETEKIVRDIYEKREDMKAVFLEELGN